MLLASQHISLPLYARQKHKIIISRHFLSAGKLEPILIRHRFLKVPFFPVHTETRKRRFQKIQLWRAFSIAFSVTVFIGYVWTEAVTAMKKLRFQTKKDTCGRLNIHVTFLKTFSLLPFHPASPISLIFRLPFSLLPIVFWLFLPPPLTVPLSSVLYCIVL